MISFKSKRWLKAQEYEKSFWEKTANHIVSGISGQLSWYGWRAGELEKQLVRYMDNERKRNTKVLEIGSGPIGIVSFLKWGERYALDPLEDYYVNYPILIELRDSEVNYLKGHGENLPFGNRMFSMVILDNVIDHTENPDRVLKEIIRVLEPNGILYFSVNLHSKWGSKIHSLLSNIYIDKGHPYTFTTKKIRDILRKNNFQIEIELFENEKEVRIKDCKSKNLKERIKGYTGLSEFLYQAICLKS